MRQLFWKEWYELRLLPLASAACVALLIFAAKSFNKFYDSQPFQLEDTFLPLGATWALLGLLAGAGLFAQEIGSGNLLLLSALPISRRRVWWVKASTALGVFLLSALSSLLVWAILDAFLLQDHFFHAPLWHQTARDVWEQAGLGGLALVTLFAVGLAVSPFLDRPISATVASILIAFTYFSALQYGLSWYDEHLVRLYQSQGGSPPQSNLMLSTPVLLGLSIALFGAISYWTFTRGETLRSAKRFQIGAVTGGLSLAVAGLVFLAGNRLQLW